MEDNGKCIILKRKEYDELVAKANSNKPDYIEVTLDLCNYYDRISSNLIFSDKLNNQLRGMVKLVLDKIDSKQEEIMKTAYGEIANMSRRERRKFLKQYE